jgi:hypothetical protein
LRLNISQFAYLNVQRTFDRGYGYLNFLNGYFWRSDEGECCVVRRREERDCGGMALQGTKALEAWCRRVTQAFLRIRLYFSNWDPELSLEKIRIQMSEPFRNIRIRPFRESVGFGFDL